MRSFVWFFGLILVALAAMAALAYPAWLLLYPTFDFPFHRIANRLGMLALAVGFFVVARHLGLATREAFGFSVPKRIFIRELLIGLVLGVVLMLPVLIAMIGLDLRDLKEGVTLDASTFARLALVGLLRGLIVAFIEESFLRGAMFTGISRESGTRVAVILTSLVYAATHFIGRIKIPHDQVTPASGVDLLEGTLHAFANPLFIADAFLCLFVVGVVLAVVRARTGSVAACIGLHAGWVWMITFVRETSGANREHPLSFLLSQFDGFVGWLVLAWTAVIGFWLYRFYSKRALSLPSAG